MFKFYLLVIFSNVSLIRAIDTALQEFSNSNRIFTSNLYREIIETSNENIIFSPTSLQICLALTLEGAKDTTASELSTALSLPTRSTTQVAIRSLRLDISTEKLTLRSSNKLYIADGYKILDSFLNIARNTYQSDVANIDFSNSDNAARVINQWVSERTNGTIQNLISPNQLNGLTKFVVINALYFKGQWEIPFKRKDTKLDTFYTGADIRKILMMNSVNDYLFLDSQELKAKVLELKYKDRDISMTFVLPHEKNGLAKIENNIEKYLNRQNLAIKTVAVSIPTFKISNLVDFKGILQKLGVKKLFENSADLTGISTKPGLFVKYVIQKAFIEVAEVGTTAAAATAVIGSIRTLAETPIPPPELVFRADHPFLFYIRDNVSGVILFVGRFVD